MAVGTCATRLAGVPFAHLDLSTAVELLLSPAGLATPIPWRLVNTYSLALAGRARDYADVLRGEGINLADGKPVSWTLRALTRRAGSSTMPGHVRGPSFFEAALDAGQDRGTRHFLLGGSPGTLERLVAEIAVRYPRAEVVGSCSPPFRPLNRQERIAQDARIRDSGADVIWVGLGTPRQDMEAARLATALGRPAVAVGAAFDFLAGTRREAPVWMQRAAMEWVFRFASEPRRLWRRYTVELVRFARLAARELLRPGPAPTPGAILPVGPRFMATSTDDERMGA